MQKIFDNIIAAFGKIENVSPLVIGQLIWAQKQEGRTEDQIEELVVLFVEAIEETMTNVDAREDILEAYRKVCVAHKKPADWREALRKQNFEETSISLPLDQTEWDDIIRQENMNKF